MSRLLPKVAKAGGRGPGGLVLLVYAFALAAVWLLLLEESSQGHFHRRHQQTFHHHHLFSGAHVHKDAGAQEEKRSAPEDQEESKGGAMYTLSLHLSFLVLGAASGPVVAPSPRSNRLLDLSTLPTGSRLGDARTSPRGPPAFVHPC